MSAEDLIGYDTFKRILESHDRFNINESSFYFDDDPEETDREFGHMNGVYWVGYCDIPDGCDFASAEEMLNAKIYDGRSIKDRWEHVIVCNIGGISVENWLGYYKDKI